MKFYIVYPNDDMAAPFDNYADALLEARAAIKRVPFVTIVWNMANGAISAHVVANENILRKPLTR